LTDISFHYYDGANWQDLTSYVTGLHVEETGIQAVSSANVLLETERSNLNSYLASPYKLVRIQQYANSTWQKLHYGYVDNPSLKTVAGTIPERSKLLLSIIGFLTPNQRQNNLRLLQTAKRHLTLRRRQRMDIQGND
jgi:hypothetical protein